MGDSGTRFEIPMCLSRPSRGQVLVASAVPYGHERLSDALLSLALLCVA